MAFLSFKGCTLVPDGDWVECCELHDELYAVGGTRECRRNADMVLRRCIEAKGHPHVARIYYYGLRVFGWMRGGVVSIFRFRRAFHA